MSTTFVDDIIIKVQVSDLKPHPLNAKVYSYHDLLIDNADLAESIKKHGVLTPLLVTMDNVIISGHRRWNAALSLGLKEVPVITSDLNDELDIEEAVLTSNKQRQKTNEQIAREFEELKRIEAKKAEKRQFANLKYAGDDLQVDLNNTKPIDQENFPDRSADFKDVSTKTVGQARDIAAEKLGVSGRTAEKAAKVVAKVDELKAEGKTEESEELKETLNQSVDRAYKQVQSLWQDGLCAKVLKCVDKNVFSKDAARYLAKYPEQAQEIIVQQIECLVASTVDLSKQQKKGMTICPKTEELIAKFQQLQALPNYAVAAFCGGSLKFQYINDVYQLYINDELDQEVIRHLCDSVYAQEAAFDPFYRDIYALTPQSCLINTESWNEPAVHKYHPVLEFLKMNSWSFHCSPVAISHQPNLVGIRFIPKCDDLILLRHAFEEAGFRVMGNYDHLLTVEFGGTRLLHITSCWNWIETKTTHPVLNAIDDTGKMWQIEEKGNGYDVKLLDNFFSSKDEFVKWAEQKGFEVEFPERPIEARSLPPSQDEDVMMDDETEQKAPEIVTPEVTIIEDENDMEAVSAVPNWQEYVAHQKWINDYVFALAKADDVDTLHRLLMSLKLFIEKVEDVFKDVVEDLQNV